MTKILKKFNKTSGEWENLSSPDVNVSAQSIPDTDVEITNSHFNGSLNDALDDIDDTTSKLERNVSWLAKRLNNSSSVEVVSNITEGKEIADIKINGVSNPIYSPSGVTGVEVIPNLSEGEQIADIKINGDSNPIYVKKGTDVTVTPTLKTGEKIADISVDGVNNPIYVKKGTDVTVTPTLKTGEKIADITVDGVNNPIYVKKGTDVTVTPTLTEGEKIADISVDGVNNPIYIKKSTDVSITPLVTEGEKIATITIDGVETELWAPEGGGGGEGVSYGIYVESPTLQNGAAYVSNNELQVVFYITGGSKNDICKYYYKFDGENSTTQDLKVNTKVELTFDLSSDSESHLISINATNPYGGTILPVSFYVYQSTFNVTNYTGISITNAETYVQGIYNVSSSYKSAILPLDIECGLVGAAVTITSERNGEQVTKSFTNETSDVQRINLDLWELLPSSVKVGDTYILNISGQAVLGSIPPVTCTPFVVSFKIISPNNLNLALSVNSKSNAETIEVGEGESISYAFTPSGPKTIPSIYYAVKIVKDGVSTLINGKFYDNTLKESGATYKSNSVASLNDNIIQNYTLDSSFVADDEATLYVKAWSYNGKLTAETEANLVIVASASDIFPRQYTEGTLFASFNSSYNFTDPLKWNSNVTSYEWSSPIEDEEETPSIDINIHESNGVNGALKTDDDGVLMMRLQNRTYATIEFTGDCASEVEYVSGAASRIDNNGFVVSVTYYCDQSTSSQKTVMLWGENFASENSLMSGMRIDANKVYWKYTNGNGGTSSLSCNVSYGTKNTVDFVYRQSDEMVLIYVNGIPNAAEDLTDVGGLSSSVYLPTTIYFGCNYYGNQICEYADMSLYEFSIYTGSLNDFQLNINGKNARLNGLKSNADVIADYKVWKKKNFIYTSNTDTSKPLCYLFKNGDFNTTFNSAEVQYVYANSNIPTLILEMPADSQFTQTAFFSRADSSNAKIKYGCSATYYAPADSGDGGTTCSFDANISYQGTSTLGYRVKNLELYMAGSFLDDNGDVWPYLFQPKDTWFPESEFTLKADVVDSAHANNSVIGEWINNYGVTIMENNPPQKYFTNDNRPKDVNLSGKTITTTNEKTGEKTDYYSKLTIKTTLEGFPILLFIKFPNTATYTLIGIYSLNLGRASYYNMGMKFLKNFCRRNESGVDMGCPAVITYYQESQTMGALDASNVWCYEFGNNDVVPEHCLWTQYDTSVLQSWGEFRYPSETTDDMWDTMSAALFEPIAKCSTGKYPDGTYTGYNVIYPYIVQTVGTVDTFVKASNSPIPYKTTDNAMLVNQHLSVKNTIAYFVIANAFGMTDSLGKNMELKTWDAGFTWYPCFYDMDTALGLRNTGAEDIPINCSIDTYKCATDTKKLSTTLSVTYHESNDYAAFNAKLWGLLRDQDFCYYLYGAGSTAYRTYEQAWGSLRQSVLKSYTSFVEMMEKKINTCGSLVYTLDYYSKYIKKQAGIDSSLIFLHGNRIEFVKEWLKKHFNYLDGIFDTKLYLPSVDVSSTDSAYYNDNFGYSFWYRGGDVIPITVQVSTPSFISLNTNNTATIKYYVDTADKDFLLYYPNTTANNTQTVLYGASIITKFDGFSNKGFIKVGDSSDGAMNGLSEFNIAYNSNLTYNNPLKNASLTFLNASGESSLEVLNLSNTKCNTDGMTGTITYGVDLTNFNKLISIDISNSDVTSLVLPNTMLQTLRINNTVLEKFTIKDQSRITNLDFTGCNKMQTINIENCAALTSLNISGLTELSSIRVVRCDNLTAVTVDTVKTLTSIDLEDNGMTTFRVSGCTNANLNITILNCPLEKIYINSAVTSNVIQLPSEEYLTGVTVLDLNRSANFGGFKYGDEEMEQYDDTFVLDLSKFPNLLPDKITLNKVTTIKYIRVLNEEDNPFVFGPKFFGGYNSLVKVFGHILIDKSALFSGLEDFYLNHDEAYSSITQGDTAVTFITTEENKYYTNISIESGVTDLSSCFSTTNVDINDVYYIMRLVGNVSNLTEMFYSCGNIVTTNLSKDIFCNCKNVKTIDSLFSGCKINSKLDDTMLTYITVDSNIIDENENTTGVTNFSDVFSGDYVISTNGDFFPEGNCIKYIYNFNPNSEDLATKDNRFDGGFMFKNCQKLVEISDSFCECQIDFANSDNYELFDNCESLQSILSSFLNLLNVRDDNILCNTHSIFAGCPKLKEVINSFSFSSDSKYSPYMRLRNDFLSSCKSTIEYITMTEKITSNSPSNAVTTGCFSNVIKLITNEGFPYDILKGCERLVEIPGLFYNMAAKRYNGDGGLEEDLTPYLTNVLLPNRILDDCISLTNLAYGFANFNGFNYTLTSNGFTNTPIKVLDNVFAQSANGGMIGQIPYRLFYNTGNTITKMSSCFDGLCQTDVTAFKATDEDIINYAFDTETNQWNEYLFDGSDKYRERLSASTYYEANKDTIPDTFTGWTYGFEINKTLLGFEPWKELMFADTFIISNYFCPSDIFLYCASNVVVDNAFNGTSTIDTQDEVLKGLRGRLSPLILKPLANNTTLSGLFANMGMLLPDEWGYKTASETYYGNIYPVQLFSYFTNLYSISSLFAGDTIWGYGVIPSGLFTPISSSLQDVSSLWADTTWLMNDYYQLPEDIFNDCVNIRNVSNMFSYSNIRISTNHFLMNTKVNNCSGFMQGCSQAVGSVPNFWESKYPYITSYGNCYKGLDSSLISNYNSIDPNFMTAQEED